MVVIDFMGYIIYFEGIQNDYSIGKLYKLFLLET